MLRDARSEFQRQMRQPQGIRLAILAVVVLVVLGAVPLFFGISTANEDPVFDSLDELAVPEWAMTKTTDDVTGNRWCLLECRLRERTAESQRPPEETAKVYEQALIEAGWQRWEVSRCPEQPAPKGSSYTCWRRDELTLDLWVREPTCVSAPERSEAQAPPSREPSGNCEGSLVSVKVRNAIDDERVGTTPSPTLSDLLEEEAPPIIPQDPVQE